MLALAKVGGSFLDHIMSCNACATAALVSATMTRGKSMEGFCEKGLAILAAVDAAVLQQPEDN